MSSDRPESPRHHLQGQRIRFFPLTDDSANKATVSAPAINAKQLHNGAQARGNGAQSPQQGPTPIRNSSLASQTTQQHALPKRPLQSGGPTAPPMRRSGPPPPLRKSIPTTPPTPDRRSTPPPLPIQNGRPTPAAQNGIQTSPPFPAGPGIDAHSQRRDNAGSIGSAGADNSKLVMDVTVPMMVLRGIAQQKGQPEPVMHSELSGAASGAAIVGFGNTSGTVLKYISNFIIQRGFGPGIFGLYSLGLSLVTLIASIFSMGLDNSMLRYIAIYRGKKEASSLRGLVIFCTALAGITGMVGALLLIFFAPTLAALRHTPKDAPLLVPTFLLMAPLIPLLCMQVIWFGGLQGFKAFKFRVLAQRLIPAIVLILLLLVVLVFFHHLKGIVIATFISTVIGTVLSLFFLFRLVSNVSKQQPDNYEVREWLGFATPNFLTTITDTVLDSTDTLLLAFFAISSVALGQYSAAIKYSNFIALPLISLNTMFAPTIAELHSKGEHQKLEAMFKVVTKWTLILSLPIFGVATVFSAPILAISGAGFVAAWPLLIAFSVGALINSGTGCVGYMLLMTGHQKLSFMNSLAGIIVNVILGVILTPRYGAMGTAISTGLAVCVLNVARLIQVRLLLKIQPFSWEMWKPLLAALIAATVSGVLFYLLYRIHIPLLLCLGLVPLFLAVYAGMLYQFKLSPEDQVVVNRLRKKLLRRKK